VSRRRRDCACRHQHRHGDARPDSPTHGPSWPACVHHRRLRSALPLRGRFGESGHRPAVRHPEGGTGDRRWFSWPQVRPFGPLPGRDPWLLSVLVLQQSVYHGWHKGPSKWVNAHIEQEGSVDPNGPHRSAPLGAGTERPGRLDRSGSQWRDRPAQ
jgi:hypothetical protein